MVVRGKKVVKKKGVSEKDKLSVLWDLDTVLSRALRPGPTRRRLEESGWLRVFENASKHIGKRIGAVEDEEYLPERRLKKTEYDKYSETAQHERFPLVSERMLKEAPWVAFNLTREQWNKLSGRVKMQLLSSGYKRLENQIVKSLRQKGLNENSSVEEVREGLKEVMGREPAEATVYDVAYELGVKGVSSKGWELSKQKLVDKCRQAGLNKNSSIEDVWEVLGNELSPNTVRNVASELGIKVKSWDRYIRKYGGKGKHIDKALNRVLEGGKVQPGSRVNLGKAERLTVGEMAVEKWMQQGLKEEEVIEKLEQAGFKEEEIKLLKKYVLKEIN